MNQEKNIYRLNLRFSMLRPNQKQAYEIISAIPPRQRMEYLCGIINRTASQKEMEAHIINAVKQALSDCQPQIQHYSKEEPEAGEIPQQMMDFLASL